MADSSEIEAFIAEKLAGISLQDEVRVCSGYIFFFLSDFVECKVRTEQFVDDPPNEISTLLQPRTP